MGLGFIGAGPAMTFGLYLELMPVEFVAVTGGWGAFTVVNQTWFVEARALPVRGLWTPYVGFGWGGELVSPASTADGGNPGSLLWRDPEDPLRRTYPYLKAGAMRVQGNGFSVQVGVLLLFDGPQHIPVVPWPDIRVGWYF